MKKFIIFCFLMSLTSLSYAMRTDSCEQIPGSWKGDWFYYDYTCPAEGEGYRYGDKIYFKFKLKHCDLSQNFSMSGTCVDGKITLNNSNATMEGDIADNQLAIAGDKQQAYLSKKS